MNAQLSLGLSDLALTKSSERCVLTAYPDPSSPLAQKLVTAGLWQSVMDCQPVPDSILALGLDGSPWTIGWGHTGPEVTQGLVWTQARADSQLLYDMQGAEQCVHNAVAVPVTRNQYIALCDFVFNVGCGAFRSSTLLRKLNAQDMAGAAAEFARWNLSGGMVMAGLVTRRAAEAALFRQGT